ncbi:cysteine--tRNA ligase [Nocardia vinacea]|uniref:cysteine--tRNA ligase n=1 Tax=Nocardia vinacea TaxID=96468 RepID=UPI0002E350E8|nr:cysteine--tRNA ligase [Nocardia vinacea]
MAISVYNTLSRSKEPFVPATKDVVRMFVCGPTVYGSSHIGHAKTYTQFDFIARYLRFRGFEVTYLQNITDVDDKIIARARELNMSPSDLATKFEEEYRSDMMSLSNTSVDVYARAHDYIAAIVNQIHQLIDHGHAYKLDDGWYFDLSTFSDYGKLSGRRELRDEDSVSRIDHHDKKRNPGDFALWKSRKDGEPFWPSDLGEGRPGWHIEDTAITESFFGPQYDLHGGAVDLIFPHHEAEVAQMEAASGKTPFVKYWLHTGLVRVDGAKMAKSAGNFMTIKEVLEHSDFRTLRYAFLSQHYRSSMEFSEVAVQNAKNARRRVENFARSVDRSRDDSDDALTVVRDARQSILDRLDDDFDTPGALAVLFDFIRQMNRNEVKPGAATWELLVDLNSLFCAFDIDGAQTEDFEIESLLERRRALRKTGNYSDADAIRDSLSGRGIVIEDTADGTRWWWHSSDERR